MARAKLAVTLDEQTVTEVDNLVKRRIYPNRSRIIELAQVIDGLNEIVG